MNFWKTNSQKIPRENTSYCQLSWLSTKTIENLLLKIPYPEFRKQKHQVGTKLEPPAACWFILLKVLCRLLTQNVVDDNFSKGKRLDAFTWIWGQDFLKEKQIIGIMCVY